MNTLFSLFPGLPWDTIVIAINMVAVAGATLHIYGVFLEKEKRRDIVFIVGGVCLFIYALWIKNNIFMLAMGGFVLGSLIELLEILTGHHKHSQKQVEDYKNNS
jgi:Ca2+/Na+ antiporter